MKKVNTEEKELGTRVLVGLSGGVNSYIAAYLLKIQKFEVLAATIVQNTNSETRCSLSAEQLQEIKDFCQRLGIAHVTIDGNGPFEELVQEKWISSRIQGRSWPVNCTSCHGLRFELLYQKMVELEASVLSTGHFAKIIKTDKEQFHIHSVHDLKLDESHILQKIPSHILSSLLLPLATMGEIELKKLAQHFSLSEMIKKEGECFRGSQSSKLLQSFTFDREETNEDEEADEEVGPSELKVVQVVWAFGMKKGIPFKGYMNIAGHSIQVVIYPKTLSSVRLICDQNLPLKAGEDIAVYQKKGGGAKLLLSGVISVKTPLRDAASEEEVWTF